MNDIPVAQDNRSGLLVSTGAMELQKEQLLLQIKRG